MSKKSIVEEEPAECCFLCGKYGYLERHHIFGRNPNRRWSERYGLTVHLCMECHRDAKEGVHFNKEKRQKLQEIGQRAFEEKYSRQKFFDVFGIYCFGEEKADPEVKKTQEEPGFRWL